MAAKLDELVDRIRRKSSSERRRPTVGEAKEVGRLALLLATKKLTVNRPSSFDLPGPTAAAVAAVTDRTIHSQPAVSVCRPSTSAVDCRPPGTGRRQASHDERRITPYDGGTSSASATQSPGCVVTSLDDELRERINQLRLLKVDVNKHAAINRELCSDILQGLRHRYPHSFDWRKCNSGSYFDKTKVASFTYSVVRFPIFLLSIWIYKK